MEKRIGEHDSGYVTTCYTFKRRPLELKFSQQFQYINQAIAFEKQIKGWARRKKEALINEDWEKLKEFSKNYTEFGKAK